MSSSHYKTSIPMRNAVYNQKLVVTSRPYLCSFLAHKIIGDCTDSMNATKLLRLKFNLCATINLLRSVLRRHTSSHKIKKGQKSKPTVKT